MLNRFFRRRGGFIPACAGKTPALQILWENVLVHPRVCGENGATQVTETTGPGSSPRVRGKRGLGAQVRERRGFIPACAGKTC